MRMPFNTKPIKVDVDGKPVPQYFNQATDDYEALEGADGASKVMIADAIPAGANIIGSVKLTDGSNGLVIDANGALQIVPVNSAGAELFTSQNPGIVSLSGSIGEDINPSSPYTTRLSLAASTIQTVLTVEKQAILEQLEVLAAWKTLAAEGARVGIEVKSAAGDWRYLGFWLSAGAVTFNQRAYPELITTGRPDGKAGVFETTNDKSVIRLQNPVSCPHGFRITFENTDTGSTKHVNWFALWREFK